MSVRTNLFITADFNIGLLWNEDVIDGTITVTHKSDGTAFDFTGFTDVFLEFYDSDTRSKLLFTLVATDNLTIPTPANGIIIVNIDYSADIAGNVEPGLFYGKLTYLDASSRVQSPGKGELEIIR